MRQITTFVIAAVVIGVSMFAVAGGAAGQGAYSDEAIQAAIDIGAWDKVQDIRPSCTAEVGGFWNKLSENLAASEGWGGVRKFSIVGWSPLSRAAWIARDAKQKYMPTPQPSDDHIVGTLADDVFVVRVTPEDLGNVVTAARLADTGIEHVVIRPRGD